MGRTQRQRVRVRVVWTWSGTRDVRRVSRARLGRPRERKRDTRVGVRSHSGVRLRSGPYHGDRFVSAERDAGGAFERGVARGFAYECLGRASGAITVDE